MRNDTFIGLTPRPVGEGGVGFALFDTPVGRAAVAWHLHDPAGPLAGMSLPGADDAATRARLRRLFEGAVESPMPQGVAGMVARLQAALAGDARDTLADVAIDLRGIPDFHQRVYAAARAVPPGRTVTYGEMARSLGEPGAARAVGQALGANPFAPLVPCHRILAASNRSGGFSAPGGVDTKLRLLEAERAQFGAEPGLF